MGRSEAEHQRDLNKLQESLLQSKTYMKRLKGQRGKKEQTSRSKNARKGKKMARGQAHAERMEAKMNSRTSKVNQGGGGGGRRKKNRGKNRRGNPY